MVEEGATLFTITGRGRLITQTFWMSVLFYVNRFIDHHILEIAF